MKCNTCGCPGAEVLFHPPKCLRRSCYMFDVAHRKRFERVWDSVPWPEGASIRFSGERLGEIVEGIMFGEGSGE